MADENADDGRCVPCDVIFYGAAIIGTLLGAILIWDYITDGQATRFVQGLFHRTVELASVTQIRGEGEPGDSDAG